jgi:hypothetical protein
MLTQSLHTTVPALFLMATSCTSSKHVEFLGFEGCPNTPELRTRLTQAEPNMRIVEVDLMGLASSDARLGWGAPTILVNGKDLFGMIAANIGSVSCRNWSSGLPSVVEIRTAFEGVE